MYTFAHTAPFDIKVYVDPGDDRTGMPLSQGAILTLIAVTASEYLDPDVIKKIEQVDPVAWYAGQSLETILNAFEDHDPRLVIDLGKNIYYTLETQFRAIGIETPADVIKTIPLLWQQVTRGDSGEWRSRMIGEHEAHVEMEQPYNCQFEQGAIQGALECFDASNVDIQHTTCLRRGDRCCTLAIKWQ